jgi:hypothetical protein
MPAQEELRRRRDAHLEVLRNAYTPAELNEILRDIGPGIDDWRERNKVIEEFILERKTWRLAWRTFLRVLGWFTAILIAMATLRNLLPPGAWPW